MGFQNGSINVEKEIKTIHRTIETPVFKDVFIDRPVYRDVVVDVPKYVDKEYERPIYRDVVIEKPVYNSIVAGSDYIDVAVVEPTALVGVGKRIRL